MSTDKKKTTTQMLSAGTDNGQSLTLCNNDSVPEMDEEINDFVDGWSNDMLLDIASSYLKTVSMKELFETAFISRPPLIEGLLYPGTYLFVGAPKLGKSFLMAQLAYHISKGLPLWDYPVQKGTALYLALEDDYRRLQNRLYRMFGIESVENLHFATSSKQLCDGLYEQLQEFIQKHPDTRLIIIDTLQKIRKIGGDKFSYASDYEIISQLKQFADSHGICLLIVHHTRKQQSEDKYDMISGTNGLFGAADGVFMLHKDNRTSNHAALQIVGRDQSEQCLYLKKDVSRLIWELEKVETELWKEPTDPILEAMADIMADKPEWSGTPTELVQEIKITIQPNTLSLRLNVNAARLQNEYGIKYENGRTRAGRYIRLTKVSDV
jgi:RecA-family ATPase